MIGKMIYSKIGRNISSKLSRSAALRPNVVVSAHNYVDRSSSMFSNDSASYKVGFVRDYLTSVGAEKKRDQHFQCRYQHQQQLSPSTYLRFDPLLTNRRLYSSVSNVSKDSNIGTQQVISQAKPKFINLHSGSFWGLIVGGTYITFKQSGLAALANLSLFWHINQGMREILADYVHQEMTRHFILISLRLFLIIAVKDVFVSMI